MFNWFKKVTKPYEGSSFEFIKAKRRFEEQIDMDTKTWDHNKAMSQLNIMAQFMETQGDGRILTKCHALMKSKLDETKSDLLSGIINEYG